MSPPIQPGTPPDGRRVLTDFLKRWVITTLGVMVAAIMVPGVSYDTFGHLLQASLLLGILNAFAAPIKVLLGCLTMGLLAVLINATLLTLVGAVVPGFQVEGFWPAVGGSLVISVVGITASLLTGTHPGTHIEFQMRTGPPQPPAGHRQIDDDDDPGGPVIDV